MTNQILIITENQDDAAVLENALSKASEDAYIVKHVTRLSDALQLMAEGGIKAILVNLSLPDSFGIETFDRLFATSPHTPIMILSTQNDESIAIEAVQRGAQGYLTQGHLGSYLVAQSLRAIIQCNAAEAKLFIEMTRAEITLNSISDAVVSTDMSGNVDYLNVAAEFMTGWGREEARGHPINVVMRLVNVTTRKAEPSPVDAVLKLNQPMGLAAGTILIRRDAGEVAIEDSAAPIHDSNGQIAGAVMVFHDIAAAKEMTMKMAHLAQHDYLTNLPNRMLLHDRITQAIAQTKRSRTHLAVLYLDIDNFKNTNDTFGHETGDRLLQSVAQRLVQCVRGADTVSRLGGDEFVILLTEDNLAADAVLTADKIFIAMGEPHVIDGHVMPVTTSIGISIYPENGTDAASLIKNADTAMYCAKRKGGNNYQFCAGDLK